MMPLYWKMLDALAASPCTRPIFFDEPLAAALDHRFGLKLAQAVPVAADEGVGGEVHRVVDQDDVDAVGLCPLQQLGEGVEIGRMHDQHVRLRIGGDHLGDRLRRRFGAPVRIAGLEHAAQPSTSRFRYAAQPWARSKPMAIGMRTTRLSFIAAA